MPGNTNLALWYDCDGHRASEKHTNLDLELADMTKEEEEQQQLLTINKKPDNKSSQQIRQHLEPERKKPIRQQFDNRLQNNENTGSE